MELDRGWGWGMSRLESQANKLLKGHDIKGAIDYVYRAKKSLTLIASIK